MAAVHSNEAFQHGSEKLAAYYNSIQKVREISPAEVRMLAGFLKTQSDVSYDQLIDYERPILHFCKK